MFIGIDYNFNIIGIFRCVPSRDWNWLKNFSTIHILLKEKSSMFESIVSSNVPITKQQIVSYVNLQIWHFTLNLNFQKISFKMISIATFENIVTSNVLISKEMIQESDCVLCETLRDWHFSLNISFHNFLMCYPHFNSKEQQHVLNK